MYRGVPRGWSGIDGASRRACWPLPTWTGLGGPLVSDTIDLNSAALEQLDRLPGINDELAGRIVSSAMNTAPSDHSTTYATSLASTRRSCWNCSGRTHLASRPPPVALRTYGDPCGRGGCDRCARVRGVERDRHIFGPVRAAIA